MSLFIRRNAPWILGLAVVAVGVYFTAGDRLLGQAGLMHAETNLARLGDVDTELMSKLDRLVVQQVIPGLDTEAFRTSQKLTDEVEAHGAGALASAASHFRESGCVAPGAAAEAELLGRLALADDVTPVQRRVVAAVLIDAVSFVAPSVSTAPMSVAAFEQLVEETKDGTWSPERVIEVGLGVESAPIDDGATTAACVVRAANAVSAILREGVVDAETLYAELSRTVAMTPTDSPVAGPLVEAAMLAAMAAERPATEMTGWIWDPSNSGQIRARACRIAGSAGIQIDADRAPERSGDAGDPALIACLAAAGNRPALELARDSDDIDLRVAFAANQALEVEPDGFEAVVAELYSDESAVPHRVRQAQLRQVVDAAVKADAVGSLVEVFSAQSDIDASAELVQTYRAVVGAEGNDPAITAFAARVGATGPALELAGERDDLEALAAGRSVGAEDAGATPELELAPATVPGFCDVVVAPGQAQVAVDDAIEAVGPGIICASAGTYEGTLELKAPGVRFFGIGDGDVRITGGLVLSAPATAVGVHVEGPVLVRASAAGSRIGSSTLEAGAVSATRDVTLAGNQLGEGARVVAPGGRLDAARTLTVDGALEGIRRLDGPLVFPVAPGRPAVGSTVDLEG